MRPAYRVPLILLLLFSLGQATLTALAPLGDRAFAQQASLTVTTDRAAYKAGDAIAISGTVSPVIAGQDVSIIATAPTAAFRIAQATPTAAGAYRTSLFTVSPTDPQGVWRIEAFYMGSKANTTFAIAQPPTLSVTPSPTVKLGQTLTVSARLLDATFSPVSGATISFLLDATRIGTAVTDAQGFAALTFRATQRAGTYGLTAEFNGSATLAWASAATSLTISPLELLILTALPGADIVTINGTAYTTDTEGKVRIVVETLSTYVLAIRDLILDPLTRYTFARWGDGVTTSSRTISMTDDLTLRIEMKKQYFVTVDSPYGKVVGAGWRDAGARLTISVEPSTVDHGNGTRRIFLEWTGSVSSTSASVELTIDSPKILAAKWKTQYRLEVASPDPAATGTGWFDAGTTASFATAREVTKAPGTRLVFEAWIGDVSQTALSGSITMDRPHRITALYRTQHLITVTSEFGTVLGAGWYDAGSKATLTVKETSVPAGFLVSKVFTAWSGGYSGTDPTAAITVNEPLTIIAQWRDDYTLLYLVGAGVGGAVAVVAGILFLRRRAEAQAKARYAGEPTPSPSP